MMTFLEFLENRRKETLSEPQADILDESEGRALADAVRDLSELVVGESDELDDLDETVNRIFAGDENLHESGWIKTGGVAAYAARSRKSGEDAVRSFNSARAILRQKRPNEDDAQWRERMDKMFDELLAGLIHRREQDGNALAANVVAHLLEKPSGGKSASKR